MKRNHGRTNGVPLQGNQGMGIKEIFHIKASDLYYSFLSKIQNLNTRSKEETNKEENSKIEDQG